MYTILRLWTEDLSAHTLLSRLEDVHPQFADCLVSPSASRRHLLARFDDQHDWPAHRESLLSWLASHRDALAYCGRENIQMQLDTAIYADQMPEFYGNFSWPFEALVRLVEYGVSFHLTVYRPSEPGEIPRSLADRSFQA